VTVSANVGRTVTQGSFSTHVERVAARPSKETRMAVVVEEVPSDVKLLEASVSAGAVAPCGGIRATRLARTAATSAEAPLRADERIVLGFPAEAMAPLSEPGARLDLLLESSQGTRRCVPVPLVSQNRKLDWQIDQRFTAGVDLSLEGYPSRIGSIQQLAAFTATFGVWLDRYRLEAGIGLGGAGCPDDTCPVDSADGDMKIDYTTIVPFHAGVQTPIWEGGELSVGLGLRYRAAKLAADTYEGRESTWMHGPVAAPYFAAVSPVDPRGWGGSRVGLAGLEVPVGYVFAENGDRAVGIGFNIRMFFTVL
jgi:hypothetical protein